MRRVLTILATPFLVLALIWAFAEPSHDREWRADYAVLPDAVEEGAVWRLSGLRDWRYDTNGEVLSEAWTTRVIDPGTLRRVWFLVEPFSGHEAIAHTMLSFEFNDGTGLIASVEARREEGEAYRAVQGGLVPTYEYLVVWATEADMARNTVFAAGDDLYMYPMDLSPEAARAALEAMLGLTAEIAEAPRWYNTFFANCTNVLARTMNRIEPGAVPFDLSWFLPGYAAPFLFEEGYIDGAERFDGAKSNALVSDRVRALPLELDEAGFSAALRQPG